MNNIKRHVNKLFKTLPKNNETKKIKINILDSMEEKYNYFISNGKSTAEASKLVIDEFGDINDIKESLSTENIQKQYDKFKRNYTTRMIIGFGGVILAPFAVLLMYLFFNPNILPIGLMTLSALPFGIFAVFTEYKKDNFKKILESDLSCNLNIIRNIIIPFSLFLMLITYGIFQNIFITLSVIPLGLGCYYLFKYIKLQY